MQAAFIWTQEDQVAFEYLRTCLIANPIFAYPDFQQQFLLFTDALGHWGCFITNPWGKGSRNFLF
jgi:hypothetical protein